MSQGNRETPIQEARSIISIGAMLIAVGCYLAAIQNVPVISPALLLVAIQVYHWFPALAALRSPQIPMLVSAATVGGVFWLLAIPFASLLAQVFNASHVASLERQTARLKRNRARIIKRRRDRSGFDVQ
jgi:hypothetical protein